LLGRQMLHRGVAGDILNRLQIAVHPVEQESREEVGSKSLKPADSLIEQGGATFPLVASKLTVHSNQQVASLNDVFLVVLATKFRLGLRAFLKVADANKRHSLGGVETFGVEGETILHVQYIAQRL